MRVYNVCAGIVLSAALVAGCTPNGNETAPSSLSQEASAAASAAPTPSASDVPSTDTTAAPAPSTSTKYRVVDLTRGDQDTGQELTTTITRVECLGTPVSGIYLESSNGSDAKPFGDVDLGYLSQSRAIEVMHHVPAQSPKYRVNIGCGYIGSTGEWQHEFRLVATTGGRTNSYVCAPNASCKLNGKPAAFR